MTCSPDPGIPSNSTAGPAAQASGHPQRPDARPGAPEAGFSRLLPCAPYNARISLATCQARWARRDDRQPWEHDPGGAVPWGGKSYQPLDTWKCRTCEAGARRAAGEEEPVTDAATTPELATSTPDPAPAPERPTCEFFRCANPVRQDRRPGRGWTHYCEEHASPGAGAASERARREWEAAEARQAKRDALVEMRARWERTERELTVTRDARQDAERELVEARKDRASLSGALNAAVTQRAAREEERDKALQLLTTARQERDDLRTLLAEATALHTEALCKLDAVEVERNDLRRQLGASPAWPAAKDIPLGLALEIVNLLDGHQQ